MKKRHRYLTFSGWISLIANVLAITGFLLDRWSLSAWRFSQGFWVAFSFVTTAYTLVIWSIWTWHRSIGSIGGEGIQKPVDSVRGGVFLLNAMAVLPVLTIWLYPALASMNDPVQTTTLRWILALAIAWAATPFIAMGLTWTGSTLGSLLDHQPSHRL